MGKTKENYIPPSDAKIILADQQLLAQQKVIEYDTKEFTIELLVQKFGKGLDDPDSDIFVPDYQRQFNWDERRQSRFIESVLMGLPVPFLFFADKDDGRLEIVDGLQRLSTCKSFLGDDLVLVGLERLFDLDGFLFRDLPKHQQRRFHNRTIRSIVLSQAATEQDRRDLFDRINTSSLIAEPAEVRRGSIPGQFTDLIDELAKDPIFNSLCPTSEQAQREREREELIARFFAFTDGYKRDKLKDYSDRVRTYMDSWLRDRNLEAKDDPALVEVYRAQFHGVMQVVQRSIPDGFRKTERSNSTPRVRFDAIAVGTALAIFQKPNITPKNVPLWLQSDDFQNLTTSSAANVRSRIIARIEFVRDRLLGKSDG